MPEPHRVVILGGGFGGLKAAQALKRVPVAVTLVDRRNFHLFQPLLYQVATGGLSPANIASPLRDILHSQRNARVLLADAVGLDPARRVLRLSDGELAYDSLIVATGARHHYFGMDHLEALAPGLKTIEDATEIRRRVLLAFERAEREDDVAQQTAWLTFVIVGGGPTGVELAGAIAEVAQQTLKGDFRAIDPTRARIIIVHSGERVLDSFAPALSERAHAALERMNIEVRTRTRCTDVREDGVSLGLDGGEERLAARTVLWAAGVRTTPIAAAIATALGAATDKAGRITVAGDCSVPGHPELFAIGDVASHAGADGNALPGVAQVAIQQGRYVAKLIRARLSGQALPPFRHRDRGSMATIGRNRAVAQIGLLRLSGFLAWLLWLFVHLLYLVHFTNRLLVVLQWGWSYVSRNRSALLITEQRVKP